MEERQTRDVFLYGAYTEGAVLQTCMDLINANF
jgi:nicotinamidase-related amidase